MENRKAIGDLGEEFAAKLLYEKGYGILETKFRCKAGEVDIIASKNDEIYFVEVKTRQSLTMGRPAEAVNREKKNHIRNAAKFYLQQNGWTDAAVSFQVIEILVNQIENAF